MKTSALYVSCVRLSIPGRMKWQMRLSWGRCEFGSSRSYDESGRSRRGWVRRRRNWLCCTDPTRSEAYMPCQKIDCGEKLKANCMSIYQFLIRELQHMQWDLTTFQKPKWQNGAQEKTQLSGIIFYARVVSFVPSVSF